MFRTLALENIRAVRAVHLAAITARKLIDRRTKIGAG